VIVSDTCDVPIYSISRSSSWSPSVAARGGDSGGVPFGVSTRVGSFGNGPPSAGRAPGEINGERLGEREAIVRVP
jgi:hypothetical protein